MKPLEEFLRKDNFKPKYRVKNPFCFRTQFKVIRIKDEEIRA